MSIFQDARQGNLVGRKLDNYISSNPNILNEQEPTTGLTPLAIAVVEGLPEEVRQLLKKGAQADGLTRDGETPLLLANWKTDKNERPLIVQLLLEKMPSNTVDSTTNAAENKTPLMYAIENKDLDSIRNLRKAGASRTIKNNDGFTASEMVKESQDLAIKIAFYTEEAEKKVAQYAATVVSLLLFIITWVNTNLNGIANSIFDADALFDSDEIVPGPEQPTKDEFLEKIDNIVKDSPLERFFENKKDFIQELAKNAAELKEATGSDNDDLIKIIKITLHQQVIYCDDSTSMKREGRWENQKKLVKRIAEITTRILPKGEGVALRFINREVDNASNLSLSDLGRIIEPMTWQPGGDTEIGTYLQSRILEPLVYKKVKTKTLERPLLISIMTDGMPDREDNSKLIRAIVECGNNLEKANYPRESVKFMIGQIGTGTSAAKFLDSLRNNTEIAPVVFVSSDKLDAKFSELRENERKLDRWLVETLFSPLKDLSA